MLGEAEDARCTRPACKARLFTRVHLPRVLSNPDLEGRRGDPPQDVLQELGVTRVPGGGAAGWGFRLFGCR